MNYSDSFYLNCPLDLEEICKEELNLKANITNTPLEITEITDGGIYFNSDLNSIRGLIPYLKTPNRLMLILSEFKCRDLPKFYNKTQKLNWNKYLLNGQYKLKIVAAKSSINNEKRIHQSFTEAMEKYFIAQAPKKLKEQFVHEIRIRFFEDTCTISIDLGGEHLHLRSSRTNRQAPLRETYAATAFYLATKNLKNYESLIDPMCGSGSITLEALNFLEPGQRDYSINKLKLFLFEKKPECGSLKLINNIPPKIFQLNDLDKAALKTAEKNLISSEVKKTFTALDLTDSENAKQLVQHDILISNLPYNERIPFSNEKYRKCFENINELFSKRAVLILPRKQCDLAREVLCYKKIKQHNFKNGGISVCFLVVDKT